MAGRGYAWQGVCMVGGVHGRGTCVADGHEWQDRRPLQQAVRILVECFLVACKSCFISAPACVHVHVCGSRSNCHIEQQIQMIGL